jgi:hypothetical protein
MTKTELIETLRTLDSRMSPPPWESLCRSAGNPTNDPEWPLDDFLQFEVEGPFVPKGRGNFSGWDAHGIAWLRTHIPDLLRHLEGGE